LLKKRPEKLELLSFETGIPLRISGFFVPRNIGEVGDLWSSGFVCDERIEFCRKTVAIFGANPIERRKRCKNAIFKIPRLKRSLYRVLVLGADVRHLEESKNARAGCSRYFWRMPLRGADMAWMKAAQKKGSGTPEPMRLCQNQKVAAY